jgi:uncharacterized protein
VSLLSSILARRWDLPPAQTRAVVREQKLRVPMDDGTVLLADRWVAEEAKDKPQPTVLVRSCYGRGGFYGLLHGRFLAERGLQVVIQSVRGTFGSEGEFNPLDERADGLTTLHWLRQQPWHEGRIGMTGESYLGFVQWAVAADADEDLTGLSIQGSVAVPRPELPRRQHVAGDIDTVDGYDDHAGAGPGAAAHAARPLQAPVDALRALAAEPRSPHDRRGGRLVPRSAWWVARDFSEGVGRVRADVQMVTGWYDAFTPWQLEDYAALVEAGRHPQLVIGPWSHVQEGLIAAGVREGLAWLRGHLHDDWSFANRAPVRVYVTGERAGGGWRELERWPPEESAARRLWLTNGARLTWDSPGSDQAGSKRYRYDPADPTPSVGGPIMITAKTVRDNRKLESRPDVITFTTEPLDGPLEAIGPARVELFARATEPYFDLFARVCDVDPDGASWNVCDALASVAPGRFEHSEEEGVWRVEFDLWPLAHRFAAGHRIRLQVSSGAHPRYVRNPGTGEHPLEAETLLPVDVEILHGPDHGSSVELPILPR